MDIKERGAAYGLPYLNNLRVLLLTLALNVLCAVMFYYGRRITLQGVLIDSAICGFTTSLIDVCIVAVRLRGLRKAGKLPAFVPQHRLLAFLPRRPVWLSLLLGALFALLTPLLNGALIRFYQIERFAFVPFLVWKMAYSSVLSVLLLELCVLRLAQPDCAKPTDPAQGGTDVVRNPLPKLSALKSWFQTVTADFGFNMLMGFLWGSTYIEGYNVVLAPAARAGVRVSALLTGVIVAARMVWPVAKNVRAACALSPVLEKRSAGIAWLPASPALFALVLTLPVIVLAYAAFAAVFALFDFQTLNFFQFFVIRALFVGLLTKAVVKLAILRYRQPGENM